MSAWADARADVLADARRSTRTLAVAAALIVACGLSACEQAMHNMYDQRRYKPLSESDLFPDGQTARPLPAGTVPAAGGALAGTSSGRVGAPPAPDPARPVLPVTGGVPQPDARANPLPVTAQLLARGRERFDIYCAPCHSRVGDGDGYITRRGFPHPPTYHSDRLRGAPDSHFFDVITHGYGAMFPYADRVAPEDRWAIVAYIRALQLSQHATIQDVPAEARARLAADGATR